VGEDGIIHHNLNHAITKTARLSSSKPNMQNLPGKDKSEVRKMFISRFGPEGVVVEGDYSQLEVVCKGVLSQDLVLLAALLNGVDFHCDWLALSPAGEGKTYDEVVYLCKKAHDPVWELKRKNIKPLTFGESFGAGVTKLAQDTGMTADDVTAAIDARKLKYATMYAWDAANIEKVKASRKVSQVRTPNGSQAGIGYLRSATDTIYHFLEGDAPDWDRHRGIMTSFTPTIIKNYPAQGLGGEVMQVQAGRVFRWLIENDRFDDKFLLTNTVHDCMWADVHKDAQEHIGKMKEILEDVTPFFNEHYPNVNWATPFPTAFECGPNMYELEHMHF
jgi:DNA polymerase-1